MKYLYIADIAKKTGLSSKMIRDYEKEGLIHPKRLENGYRVYQHADVELLNFIRQARLMNFSLSQIKELLCLKENPNRQSAQVKAVVAQHLEEVERQLENLYQVREYLHALHQACKGDSGYECAIINALSGDKDEECSASCDKNAQALAR